MNENVLGFIKWASGIIITLAIISISFLVFNMAKEGTMEGVNQINEMNQKLAESDVTIYDGAEVTGTDVRNIIKEFEDEYIGINVKTGKNPSGIWYGYNVSISSDVATIGSASTSKLSDATDEKSTYYINPYGKFEGKVYRDKNGAVAAICFTQQ